MTPIVTSVEVLGEAVPKGRPRAFRTPKGIRMHTPARTANYETTVRLTWSEHVANDTRVSWPIRGPVAIRVAFYRTPPASLSNKKRFLALNGTTRPTTRPDVDNLLKAILDALNGIAFVDDAQIVSIEASKAYGEQAKSIIQVTAIEGA